VVPRTSPSGMVSHPQLHVLIEPHARHVCPVLVFCRTRFQRCFLVAGAIRWRSRKLERAVLELTYEISRIASIFLTGKVPTLPNMHSFVIFLPLILLSQTENVCAPCRRIPGSAGWQGAPTLAFFTHRPDTGRLLAMQVHLGIISS
jgi:hypothetical protein